MKTRYPIFFLLWAITFWSCQPDSDSTAPLVVTLDSIAAQSRYCKEDSDRCTQASVLLPVVLGGREGVSQRINDSISLYSTRMIGFGDDPDPDPRISVQRFVSEYDRFLEEGEPSLLPPWECRQEGQVLWQTDSLLSVEVKTISYTGGAHPNAEVWLSVFHLSDGRSLRFSDILTEEEAFSELAARYFQKSKGLESKEDLFEAGYFWEGEFTLPDNFALTEKGILLFYNSYEVAPYSLGPTEYTIPWAELAGMLREEKWIPAS
jgi:hypothetical protein